MNIPFKSAVIVSTLAHSAIFIPLHNAALPVPKIEFKKPMVVEYVIWKERPRVEFQKREPLSTVRAPQAAAQAPSVGNSKIELKESVGIKPGPRVNPSPAGRAGATGQGRQAASSALRQAKEEARIKTTKYYIDYYQFIREKIRQRLDANYQSYLGEGEVRLLFILNSNGSLVDVSVDPSSANDGALRDMAVASTKEASPFPAFPRALSLPRISFDVLISFKKSR